MKLRHQRFENALAYNWPLFLVLPVIAGVAISYLFGIYHRPLPYEQINIFAAVQDVDSDSLCDNLQVRFSNQNLKEVTITSANPNDAIFPQKLSVVGYNRADLFILPFSVLNDLGPNGVMLPFSEKLKDEYINEDNSTYYVDESLTFGVLLKSASNISWLEDYIDFLSEDYYLCINVKSKNIADFGMYDNAEYDLALQAFSYLLGEGQ
jgi:hypothetical protein